MMSYFGIKKMDALIEFYRINAFSPKPAAVVVIAKITNGMIKGNN